MGNSCSGSSKRGSGKVGNSCVSITGTCKVLSPQTSSVLGKTRDPAFNWKINGFAALLEKGTIPTISGCFHCSGYKWYLELNPMHKQSDAGIPFVALSLYLSHINIKADYTINAVFEISMYNHLNGTYRGYEASYSFQFKKKKSDVVLLIPLEELLKSSDFLVDDCCIFGATVIKADASSCKKNPSVAPEKSITVHNLFLQKKGFIKGTYTLTFDSSLKLDSVLSPSFEVAGHTWYITFYPHGNGRSTNSVSMFLSMHESNKLGPDSGMMIELTLSILDQGHGKQHFSRQGRLVFNGILPRGGGWGWCNFIPLETLMDLAKGYLVGSKCIVKADITIIGSTNDA